MDVRRGLVSGLSHTFGSFFAAGLLAAVVLGTRWKSPAGGGRKWRDLAAVAGAALASAVWLMLLLPGIQANRERFWNTAPIGQQYLAVLEFVWPAVLVSAPLAVLGAVAMLRAGDLPRRTLLCLAVVAVPILVGPGVASMFSHGPHHFVLDRYFIALVPLAVIPVAWLPAALPYRVGPLAVLGLAGLWAWQADLPRHYRLLYPDVRAAAAYLRHEVPHGRRIVFVPGAEYVVFAYYGIGGHWPVVLRELPIRRQPEGEWYVLCGHRRPRGGDLKGSFLDRTPAAVFRAIEVFQIPISGGAGPTNP